ncbi:MAG: hypothetical protein ACXQT4_03205 [Methanotrichaceae archaeon]
MTATKIGTMDWYHVIRKVQPVGKKGEPKKNGIITLLPEFVERHNLIKNNKIISDDKYIYKSEGQDVIVYTNASRDLLYILPEDSPHMPSFHKDWLADEVTIDISEFYKEKDKHVWTVDSESCWRPLIEFMTSVLVNGTGRIILQKNGGKDRLDISLLEMLDNFEKELHGKVTEDGKKIIFELDKPIIDHDIFAMKLDEIIQLVIRLFDLFIEYLDEANQITDPLAKRTLYELLKRDVHRKEYETDRCHHECVALAKLTMYKSMLNPAFIHDLNVSLTDVMGFRLLAESLEGFADEIESYMYILDTYQEILPTLVAPDKLKILSKHLNDININYKKLLNLNDMDKGMLYNMAREEAIAITELHIGRLKLYDKITKGSEDVLITLFADLFLGTLSMRRIVNSMIVRRLIKDV